MSTLGVNISRKVIELSDLDQVRLLIWDLSGNEKFDGARADYIKGSSGALLVCDISRPDTVARLVYFKDFLYASCPDIPLIFIGNKADLIQDDSSSIQQIMEFSGETGLPFKITSAKTGVEVDTAFLTLTQMMVFPNGR
jgi:GTPase SAR1 family protein